MDQLIKALDKKEREKFKETFKILSHPVDRMRPIKGYTDKAFSLYFSDNYEKRFTPYLDPDRCIDGFVKNERKRRRGIFYPRQQKLKIEVEAEINSLEDLYKLADDYPPNDDVDYSIYMNGIHKIKPYLKELLSFVGLEELKENLLDQIIYFIHQPPDDYLHTVLYGPPGTGKTEIAKILGKIYSKLGILSKESFIKVTRSDFVAGYLGQTAIKTRKLIEENLGGVIFIDEAYALGNQEKRDSFSKEALDTLCELLSDYKDKLMVIIAGYKTELEQCFFSYNPGLSSRFAWRFEINEYTSEQLSLIFKKKVDDANWRLDENVGNSNWFEKNKDSFKNYGRDIENLFSKCKICHFRRLFGKKEHKHCLSQKDLENGYEKFLKFNDPNKNKKESAPSFMYT